MAARHVVCRAAHDALCTVRVPHSACILRSPLPFFDDVASAIVTALTEADFVILGPASPTGGGVGASTAATAEPRTPSAQADQDGRPPTPPPPHTFHLVRHHDLSGQTGTGIVAEGVQFSDGTAALRWRGGHPATAVWPNVEEILAVHGHEGATELVWLEA
jgi:hypothetical protein